MSQKQYTRLTVSFAQGLVKTFIAPDEMLVVDLGRQLAAFGRVRSMRELKSISDPATIELLVTSGNATLLRVRP